MNFIPLFNPKDFSVSNDTVRIINPLPFLRGNHLFVPDHVQMPDGTVLPCDWFAYSTDLSLPLCDIEEPITMHVGQNFIDLLENHVNGWVNADQLLSRTTFPSLESITIEVESEHFRSKNGIVFQNDSFLIIPPLNNYAQAFPLIDITISEENKEEMISIAGKQDVFGGVYSNDGKVFLQFRGNVNTVSYVMRPGVVEIADYAFWKLTAIGLGESGRTCLSKVILPEGLKKIGKYAFDSSGLRHINLPDSLKEIGYAAFAGCTQLALETLPASLRRIGTAAFYNTATSSITIPKNVIHIGRRVFNMCIRLERINVASGNKYYTSVDGILYSKDMTQLIAFPYLQNYQLYDYEAHKGEDIDYDHYWGIPRKEYVMPDSVSRIENCTFYYAQFETLSLGDNLHTIECGSFEGCKIDKLIIGRNITKIASDAFKRYSSHGIKNIEVSEDNEYFCSQKGILYNKEKTSLLRCPSQYTGTISIPNTVTTICKNALAEINVQELQIPDSVTRIEANAFEGSQIVVLYLSRNLTYIAQRAFDYCDTLTTVYVSSKMKKTVERILSRRKSYEWIPKVEILVYDK